MVRRSSTETFERIDHMRDRITLHTGRPARPALARRRACARCEPHEIYNLAAMSFVAASWNQPVLTAEFSGVGVTRMLEAMREVAPQAALLPGLLLGDVRQGAGGAADRADAVLPAQPYGVAKAYGHFITVNYRESYDLFACSGILFNHESTAAASSS